MNRLKSLHKKLKTIGIYRFNPNVWVASFRLKYKDEGVPTLALRDYRTFKELISEITKIKKK
jgi:hypothetical protein